MSMVTVWLSMASGGTVFSSGMSKPAACTGAIPASRANTASSDRRMARPHRSGWVFSHPTDEAEDMADCRSRGRYPDVTFRESRKRLSALQHLVVLHAAGRVVGLAAVGQGGLRAGVLLGVVVLPFDAHGPVEADP